MTSDRHRARLYDSRFQLSFLPTLPLTSPRRLGSPRRVIMTPVNAETSGRACAEERCARDRTEQICFGRFRARRIQRAPRWKLTRAPSQLGPRKSRSRKIRLVLSRINDGNYRLLRLISGQPCRVSDREVRFSRCTIYVYSLIFFKNMQVRRTDGMISPTLRFLDFCRECCSSGLGSTANKRNVRDAEELLYGTDFAENDLLS